MEIFKPKRIYLDYASTTPLLPEVESEMKKFWSKDFYNPSALYEEGVDARRSLENYRTRVAKVIGSGKKDVVFTSGGTESDNLAILGVFEGSRSTVVKPHVLVTSIEHPAVLEVVEEVSRRGGEVDIIPVNEEGLVSPSEIEKLIRPSTVLVSVMLANNEIGTVEPISRISKVIKEYRKNADSTYPYLHTDASQAPNYLPINVENLGVDLLTLDGSKVYGPKGVGILVVRPGVTLRPTTWGGGQETGLRSGTENIALIAGFTKALELAARDAKSESVRISELRDRLKNEIRSALPEAVFNGSLDSSLPNILSVSLPGSLSEFMVLELDQEGVMASVGSACASSKLNGSNVLRAIGKPELAESTIRFSLGRYIKSSDMDRVAKIFIKIARHGMLEA